MQKVKAAWFALDRRYMQRSFTQEFLPTVMPHVVTSQQAAAALGSKNIVQQVSPNPVLQHRDPGQSRLLPAIKVSQMPPPQIDPAGFAGAAADGRPLSSLLAQPLIDVYANIGNGMTLDQAMTAGMDSLDRILTTELQDAARSAESVTMVVHRVTYYIRVVEPGACGRCQILAGVHYKVNAGFLRHPHCRCHHKPGVAIYNDPVDGSQQPTVRAPQDRQQTLREIFDNMTVEQQNKTFTVSGAQAIRDGADVQAVVNSRRSGMSTITDQYGNRFATTTAGARRGRVRLLPETIYKIAGNDHAELLRLLQVNGYIR